jgi:hypothetical protein
MRCLYYRKHLIRVTPTKLRVSLSSVAEGSFGNNIKDVSYARTSTETDALTTI